MCLSYYILTTTLQVGKIIIPILQMKELRLKEVQVFPMVTEPVSGRDVATAIDPN